MVERVQPNSCVIGLRKTPIVGLIWAAEARELRKITPTIIQP
jgi:hypothetical protein